ncbi:malate dehydrogenase (NAD) [Candidatus Methanoperedens nitroreducens]|uniref:Malate dehydrogenase n=1 Tax=Candidatus Methanoperedens nitratireducens TaxID=1392998 RepID=A0A062VAF1_9EURY|nr:malate dehydrogenase [Candidatus Methanoperedens nitroreducens]KCZ72315.1 malate dehydrogenase (NAD) [Candidatus Methanoperedens nitroreducens]MDJ1420781.1 malate dehydrogenase [Candidatus Methanoperedens sp.]
MSRITVIGAGAVGATAAQRIAEKELGDVVLIDIVEGLPQGKALDLMESGPLFDYDSKIIGTNDYKDMGGSDIVVITAGIARKPGMTREDLLKINTNIIREVSQNIATYAPESVIITVTNPLDLMTYITMKTTNFEPGRVFGMSGVLDSGRFAAFIAMELGCSVRDIRAMVLGGHGDTMVPLPRFTTVSGIPITELISPPTIQHMVDRTVNGGAEIVNLLKTGSAFYAPSAAVTNMVEAVIKDTKQILPVCAYLNGEYGKKGIYLGVPVKLGRRGVEEVIELKLTDDERKALDRSAEAVRSGIASLNVSG